MALWPLYGIVAISRVDYVAIPATPKKLVQLREIIFSSGGVFLWADLCAKWCSLTTSFWRWTFAYSQLQDWKNAYARRTAWEVLFREFGLKDGAQKNSGRGLQWWQYLQLIQEDGPYLGRGESDGNSTPRRGIRAKMSLNPLRAAPEHQTKLIPFPMPCNCSALCIYYPKYHNHQQSTPRRPISCKTLFISLMFFVFFPILISINYFLFSFCFVCFPYLISFFWYSYSPLT